MIGFGNHVIGNGAHVLEVGSKLGDEGIISKQLDRLYKPGPRHLGQDQVSMANRDDDTNSGSGSDWVKWLGWARGSQHRCGARRICPELCR